MQKLTDDFWRRYTENTPKSLLFKLHQKSITPDSLLDDIENAVGKPYLKICGPVSQEEKNEKWQLLEIHLATFSMYDGLKNHMSFLTP